MMILKKTIKQKNVFIEYSFYFFFSMLALDGFFLTNNYTPTAPSHFLLAVLIIVYFLIEKNTLYIDRSDRILIALLLLAMISMLFAFGAKKVFLSVISFGYYVFIIIFLKNILKIYKISIYKALIIYSIPLLSISIFSFANKISYSETGRLSYSINYNTTWFAAHLIVIILLSIYLIIKNEKKKVSYFSLLIAVFFLLQTQTRTAIFSLILAIMSTYIFFFFVHLKTTRINFKLFFIYFIILFIFIYFYKNILLFLSNNFPRIYSSLNFKEVGAENATAGRSTILLYYLEAIKQNPFNFAGWGMASLTSNFSSPHNAYITLLYESSIIGLILFLYYFIYLIFDNLNNKFFVYFLFFLLIYSFGNDMIHYKYFYIILISFFLVKHSHE